MEDSLSWPLSRSLLDAVLADRLSDRLVAELVWERLGYRRQRDGDAPWLAGPQTPQAWRDAFPEAPEVVASRPASVALTRSIAREPVQKRVPVPVRTAGACCCFCGDRAPRRRGPQKGEE